MSEPPPAAAACAQPSSVLEQRHHGRARAAAAQAHFMHAAKRTTHNSVASTPFSPHCSRDTQLPLLVALGLRGPLSEARVRALLAYLDAERPWTSAAARALAATS